MRIRRTLMAAAVAGVLLVTTGCGWSPTMDRVIDSGLAAVAIDRANWDQVEVQLLKGLDARDATSIDAIFTSIAEARDQMLVEMKKVPSTQPADAPDTHWLSDKWIGEAKASAIAKIALMKAERQKLAAEIRMARANVDIIEKRFMQANKLRKSWGPNADMKANLEYLTEVVEMLVKKEVSP